MKVTGTSWKVMEKPLADEAGVQHRPERSVVENQGDIETFLAQGKQAQTPCLMCSSRSQQAGGVGRGKGRVGGGCQWEAP